MSIIYAQRETNTGGQRSANRGQIGQSPQGERCSAPYLDDVGGQAKVFV